MERERLEDVVALARTVKGFMPDDEGDALLEAALCAGRAFPSGAQSAGDGPGSPVTMVEVGSWCGKSSLYLGAAAEATDSVLFCVDHHRGSMENQPGWEHHDPDLVDAGDGRIDTLPHWRRSVAAAQLEHCVIGMIGDSATIASHWSTPLAFCFIDGGHGSVPAQADLAGWSRHVMEGGWLAIHDVFEDPSDGGRPPYEIWRFALDSGLWVQDGEQGSLKILRRLRAKAEGGSAFTDIPGAC